MKKIIIGFFVSLVLFILIIAGYIYWQLTRKDIPSVLSEREKQQAITKIVGHSPVYSPKEVTGITYKGHSVSFVYPSNATLRAKTMPNPLDDSILWHSITPYLFVTVATYPVNSLNQLIYDPNVNLRLKDSSYVQKNITWQGTTGLEFTKSSGGLEQCTFFLINRRVYSFVVTGDAADDVTNAMYNLLTSARIVSK